MSLKPKSYWLLLGCLVFMLLCGAWALTIGIHYQQGEQEKKELDPENTTQLMPTEMTRQKRGLYTSESHEALKEKDNDKDNEKSHIKIEMTNVKAEEKKDVEKDLKVKQALLRMVKNKLHRLNYIKRNRLAKLKCLKKKWTNSSNVATPVVKKHLNRAPGLDFRREFGSDEPNPYIE